MKNTIAVILAAGRGTRMKSDTPKVMHTILGKPMIWYVVEAVKKAGVKRIVVVTGFGSDAVKDFFKDSGVKTVLQKRLSGSGDAVNSARKEIASCGGNCLVVYGDTPLVSASTIKRLLDRHAASSASMTLLTAVLKNPSGYGRIIRDTDGRIKKIAEEDEAREYKKEIKEVNVGTCVIGVSGLFEALKKIGCDNAKKEYYLTDAVKIFSDAGRRVESVAVEDIDEMTGVNSRVELAKAASSAKYRVLEELMLSGVTIQDPSTTVIYPGVKIGKESVIYPHTMIESGVKIGEGCHIGPFARLRSGTEVADKAEVGNFVELVRTKIGRSTKVKHHTYLGDTSVGAGVNIGAGTITANYDGKNKNKTVIGDGAFIGVGTILIAPVKVGRRARTGAGTVLLKGHNVKDGATAVGVPARILEKRRGERRRA